MIDTKRDYITTHDVLLMHRILIERYGGANGVRDMGSIEAAIFRPQCGYYLDIVEEAAALFESLLINHPFVDGNKRVAFAACDSFLRINGYRIEADPAWLLERILHWIAKSDDRFNCIISDLRTCILKD